MSQEFLTLLAQVKAEEISPDEIWNSPFPTDPPVNAVKMLGGQLVETLQTGVSVIVRLPDSPAFVVPASIMEWLRKSLQQ